MNKLMSYKKSRHGIQKSNIAIFWQNTYYTSLREPTYHSRVKWLAITRNHNEDPEASKKLNNVPNFFTKLGKVSHFYVDC